MTEKIIVEQKGIIGSWICRAWHVNLNCLLYINIAVVVESCPQNMPRLSSTARYWVKSCYCRV